MSNECQAGETTYSYSRDRYSTAIRRTAIRETSISRHHGGPMKGSTETLQLLHHYHIEGLGKEEGPKLLCRETIISRTADVIFSSLEPISNNPTYCGLFSITIPLHIHPPCSHLLSSFSKLSLVPTVASKISANNPHHL